MIVAIGNQFGARRSCATLGTGPGDRVSLLADDQSTPKRRTCAVQRSFRVAAGTLTDGH